jgi:GNAT superfamily N-acetyltransferase
MNPISELSVRLGDGNRLTLRTAGTVGVAAFREYFESLGSSSRFCRFLTPVSISSLVEVSAVTKSRADCFVLLLENSGASEQIVIAELNCGYDNATNAMEFAVSVSDVWQGRGLGEALVRWLESRARKLGVARIYGDTFRSNGAALQLACKLGFLTLRHHADWQLVRCEKMIGGASQ